MKFGLEDKKKGYLIKERLIEIAKQYPTVLYSDVMEAFGYIPAPETFTLGWDSDFIKSGKNMRVAKSGTQWFLYIFGKPHNVEPIVESDKTDLEICLEALDKDRTLIKQEIGVMNSMVEELVKLRNSISLGFANIDHQLARIDAELYNLSCGTAGYLSRPCIVKAKKSGRKEERQDRNARFHRWADLSKGVQQVVAIVEFGDGHVEQVQPDRVIFKELE